MADRRGQLRARTGARVEGEGEGEEQVVADEPVDGGRPEGRGARLLREAAAGSLPALPPTHGELPPGCVLCLTSQLVFTWNG